MDIVKLKEEIIASPKLIKLILEKLNFHFIKDYGQEYRAAISPNHSPTGVCVKKDSLLAMVRSEVKSVSGDIFTVVSAFENISFKDSIKFVCNAIGKSYEDYKPGETITLPFGGYFKSIKNNEDVKLQVYDESILKEFVNIGNKRFQKDGINLKVQTDFEIMYDHEESKIIVPWRDVYGQLIGIMARVNQNTDWCNKNKIPKWKPLANYNFPKSKVLYGLYQNRNDIIQDGTIIVTESEKGVLQLRSMEIRHIDYETGEISYKGINLGVAVGSHSISDYQISLILSCYPKNVIIAFDEDVEEDILIELSKKILSKCFLQSTKVGYIKDKYNKYLLKGSKTSPTDFGKEIFEKLIKECIVWV